MKNKGFTLIELVVVIAIISVLMAYAIPNYREYVIQSKRSEAHNRLLEIAGLYEKFYANTNGYPTSLAAGGLGLDANFITGDNYAISTAAANGGGWMLTATAINKQVADVECPTITFDNLGQKGPANTECWND